MLSSAEESRITTADVRALRANVWQTTSGSLPFYGALETLLAPPALRPF